MDSQEVVDLFRSQVNDVAQPQLWPDDEVYGYLDEAQIEFCRLTDGIGDTSSVVTKLDTAVDQYEVDLSDVILKVRGAWFVSDGRPIEVINFSDMANRGISFDGTTGRPSYLIVGMQPGLAHFHPKPIDAEAVQLVVDRMPLKTLTQNGGEVIEVSRQHQRHLTLWMRHLAYSKQDSETRDDKKAEMYKDEFERYCLRAKAEKERSKHKTRVVQYGGIGSTTQQDTLNTRRDYYNRR